jgi:hypothetical protein
MSDWLIGFVQGGKIRLVEQIERLLTEIAKHFSSPFLRQRIAVVEVNSKPQRFL